MLFSFFPSSDCNTPTSVQSAAVALINIWLMVKISSTRLWLVEKKRRARSTSLILSRSMPRISRISANRTAGWKFPHRRRGSGESSMKSLCAIDESAVSTSLFVCSEGENSHRRLAEKRSKSKDRTSIHRERERKEDVCSILLVSDPWRVYSLWV